MAWERTGTVAVTNGSATVTGTGTGWAAPTARAGYIFEGPDGEHYEIQSVDSTTQITLANNYAGTTASAQTYAIIPTAGANNDLHAKVEEFLAWARAEQVAANITDADEKTAPVLADAFGIIDSEASNVLKRVTLTNLKTTLFGSTAIAIAAGTEALPGLAATGDTDTGIYWPSANAVAISTGGSERLRVNSAGKVGLGTTAPDGTLHVHTGTAGTVTPIAVADDLVVENSTSAGVSILSPDASNATLVFGSPSDNDYFYIQGFYNSGSPFARFTVNGSERMRIDANGRLLVGGVAPTGGERLLVAGASSEIAVNATSGAASIRFREAGTERAKISTLSGSGGLLFESAGTERMRIDNSGNLGLGTSSPTSQLHLLKAGGTTIKLGTSQNTSEIEARESGASNLLVFSSNNSVDHMVIDGSGNVGLGTTAPSDKLDVVGADGEAIRFRTSTRNIAIGQISGEPAISWGSGTPLTFTSGGVEALRIDSSGNLGLGTSAPNFPLSVRKGASGSTVAELKNAGGFGISVTPQAGGSGSVTEIGLLAGESLSFAPNSTEAMRITSAGNVGIGNTNPIYQLVVASGGAAGIEFGPNYTSGANLTQHYNRSTSTYLRSDVIASEHVWQTSGTERMRLNSSGNLGLGTTSPQGKLSVVSGASDHIRLEGTSGDAYGLWTSATGTSLTVGSWGNGARINLFDSSELITFGVGAASEERMRIDNSGNVGIGSTNPQSTLDLGEGSAGRGITWGGASGSAKYNSIFSSYSGAGLVLSSMFHGSTSADSYVASFTGTTRAAGIRLNWTNDNGIQFFTDSAAAKTAGAAFAPSERMRIDSSGDVGIGLTNPSFYSGKLTVAGNLAISSGNRALFWNSVGDGLASIQGVGTNELAFMTSGSYTERMRIDSSGNVGVGVSNPSSYAANADNLVVGGEANAGITIASSSVTGNGGIYFADGLSGSEPNRGIVAYAHTNDAMQFFTAASERMRIDSSGNVGIGTTSPSATLDVVGGSTLLRLYDGTNNATAKVSQSGEVITLSHAGVASGGLAFATGSGSLGTERMRIDSSGNVGIGTSSPDANSDLQIQNDASNVLVRLVSSSSGVSGIDFGDSADIDEAWIRYWNSTNHMEFRVNNTERMRIDSSGNLLAGTTSAATSSAGFRVFSGGNFNSTRAGQIGTFNRLSSDGGIFEFQKDSVSVGSISVTGSATSYNTSSDARLKDNIQDAGHSGETIDAIRVVQHDWKADGSHVDFGFVAQELNEVYPDAVTVPDDPEEMQSVDYSKLVPLLLKEIQDLRKRVSDLEEN